MTEQPKLVGDNIPQLWDVQYTSQYYPGGRGTFFVNQHAYVLAESHDQALEKATDPLRDRVKEMYNEISEKFKEKEQISAKPVELEQLIPSSQNVSGNYNHLVPVELSLEEDRKKYKLRVCLVPDQ